MFLVQVAELSTVQPYSQVGSLPHKVYLYLLYIYNLIYTTSYLCMYIDKNLIVDLCFAGGGSPYGAALQHSGQHLPIQYIYGMRNFCIRYCIYIFVYICALTFLCGWCLWCRLRRCQRCSPTTKWAVSRTQHIYGVCIFHRRHCVYIFVYMFALICIYICLNSFSVDFFSSGGGAANCSALQHSWQSPIL